MHRFDNLRYITFSISEYKRFCRLLNDTNQLKSAWRTSLCTLTDSSMMRLEYLSLLLLHLALVKAMENLQPSTSTASNDIKRKPNFSIDLNELPLSDHEEGNANKGAPFFHTSQNPIQSGKYMSREDVKATYTSCYHKQGCSHWDHMRKEEKDWSRTRRNRYQKPVDVRRAEYRKYSSKHKKKIFSDPKRKEAFKKHYNESRKVRIASLTAEKRKEYRDKRNIISSRSKRKRRMENKEQLKHSANDEQQRSTSKRRKVGPE